MSEEIPANPVNSNPNVNRSTVHIVYNNQDDRSTSTDSMRSDDYFSRQWSVLASMARTHQTLADCLALLMHDEREED